MRRRRRIKPGKFWQIARRWDRITAAKHRSCNRHSGASAARSRRLLTCSLGCGDQAFAALRRKRWDSLPRVIAGQVTPACGGRYPRDSSRRRSAKLNCGPWIAVRNLAWHQGFRRSLRVRSRPIALCLRCSGTACRSSVRRPPKGVTYSHRSSFRRSQGSTGGPSTIRAMLWMGTIHSERSTHTQVSVVYAATARHAPTETNETDFEHHSVCPMLLHAWRYG
jgi:hypothetical protein